MVAKITNPTHKPKSRTNTREGPFRGPENPAYSPERRAKVKARVFLTDTARTSGAALGSPGTLTSGQEDKLSRDRDNRAAGVAPARSARGAGTEARACLRESSTEFDVLHGTYSLNETFRGVGDGESGPQTQGREQDLCVVIPTG